MISTLITWHLEMLSMIEDMIKASIAVVWCFALRFFSIKHNCCQIPKKLQKVQEPQIPFLNRMKLHATVSNWSSEKTEAGKLRLTLIKGCIFYAL